jgi:hypothetical protein
MLSSTAKQGDVAIRTDIGRTFRLATTTPTVLSSWYELLARRNTVTTVNSQTAMLGLGTLQVGDMVLRSDLNKAFVLTATPPSLLASWTEVPQRVQSVAGLTGDVTLTTANVAEGTRLYYTDDRVRAAVIRQTVSRTSTTTATSEAALFNALSTKVSRAGDVISGNVLIQNGDLSISSVTTGGNFSVAGSSTLNGNTTINAPLIVAPTVPGATALTIRDSFGRNQLMFTTENQAVKMTDVADVTSSVQLTPVELLMKTQLSTIEARSGYIRLYDVNGNPKLPVVDTDVTVKRYVDNLISNSITDLPVRQFSGTTSPTQPSAVLGQLNLGPTATSNVTVQISGRSSANKSATFTMHGAYNTTSGVVQQLGMLVNQMKFVQGGGATATMTPNGGSSGLLNVVVTSTNQDSWTWKATVTFSKAS